MFFNDVGLLHFSYRRYLEKAIRERFGLMGNPLKLVLREGTDRRAKAGTKTVPKATPKAVESSTSPPSRRAKRAG
jgi:hypothetical protein